MYRDGQQTHLSTTEARAGESPDIVRWMLAAGLVLVIMFFAVIGIWGLTS